MLMYGARRCSANNNFLGHFDSAKSFNVMACKNFSSKESEMFFLMALVNDIPNIRLL